MKITNIFSRLVLSAFLCLIVLVAVKASAETVVIIKNVNSVSRQVELTNIVETDVDLSGWKLDQQNLPVGEANPLISTDLSGTISAMSDRSFAVEGFGPEGAIFYLYDQDNNLVMSATLALNEEVPVISGVSPVSGSRVGSLTTLTFSSSKFNDPGCQVDGLNWGSPCQGLTFMAIPGWGNVEEGPFTLTIRDTNSVGVEGRLDISYIKDVTPPTLVSATAIDATTISLSFNEYLKSPVLSSDFMVSGNSGDNPVVSATVVGSVIVLKLQNSFLSTDNILLNINPFNPISIKDTVGNEFIPVETISVVNNIPVVVTSPAGQGNSSGGGGGSRTTGYLNLTLAPGGQVLGFAIFRFNNNLSQGQKHPDVMELQKRLIREGFMASASTTDYFGPKTLAAVKLYQKKNKLPTNGYVGPMTRSVLNGWFTKNRPVTNLANVNQQELIRLQNLLEMLLKLIKK